MRADDSGEHDSNAWATRSHHVGILAVLAIALISGVTYAVVTPPGRVPDETGHFLRGVSIAEGNYLPAIGLSAPGHHFPLGIRMFIYRATKTDAAEPFAIDDLLVAWKEPLRPDQRSGMEFPAWYTPVPYAVTASVASVGIRLGWRPFVIFYLGRIANLLAMLMLVTAAMFLIPRRAVVIGAALLLPMTLYQLASWSADAMTIAFGFLMTALIIRNIEATSVVARREVLLFAAVSLVSGLCKPAYFLLGLSVFFIPTRRFGSRRRRVIAVAAIVGAMAAGTWLAMAAARAGHYHPRVELPVDPSQQVACIRADPLRFAGVLLTDFQANGRFYLEETIGRLGVMNIKLPPALIVAEWLLLLAAGITSGVRWRLPERILVLIISAATIAGISLAQYLVWSIICGDRIEGVQGRYYLPLLPLLLFALASAKRIRGPSLVHVAIVGIVAHAVALVTLFRHSWM